MNVIRDSAVELVATAHGDTGPFPAEPAPATGQAGRWFVLLAPALTSTTRHTYFDYVTEI